MNKKAAMEMEKIVGYAIPIVVLLLVVSGLVYKYWPGLTGKDSTLSQIQESTKIDKRLFDIKDIKGISEREKLIQDSIRKCTSLTSPSNCMGTKDQRTGCAWGRTSSGFGCFSCLDTNVFGQYHGQCISYKSIFSTLVEFEEVCKLNPCNFESAKRELNKGKTCLFTTAENPEVRTKENAQCF